MSITNGQLSCDRCGKVFRSDNCNTEYLLQQKPRQIRHHVRNWHAWRYFKGKDEDVCDKCYGKYHTDRRLALFMENQPEEPGVKLHLVPTWICDWCGRTYPFSVALVPPDCVCEAYKETKGQAK